jgi:hypothetical protein
MKKVLTLFCFAIIMAAVESFSLGRLTLHSTGILSKPVNSAISFRRSKVCKFSSAKMLLSLEHEQFEKNVRGEWIGYEAEFKMWGGELVPVPDWLLPDSFVEWEVVVKGFEHICSSGILPDETGARALFLRQTRLLPSVGCGVDAVPTEVKTLRIPTTSLCPTSAGSYSEGPAQLTREGSADETRWSFGLAAPPDASGPPRRVRIEGGGFGASLRRVRVWVEERLSDLHVESATTPSRDAARSQAARAPPPPSLRLPPARRPGPRAGAPRGRPSGRAVRRHTGCAGDGGDGRARGLGRCVWLWWWEG